MIAVPEKAIRGMFCAVTFMWSSFILHASEEIARSNHICCEPSHVPCDTANLQLHYSGNIAVFWRSRHVLLPSFRTQAITLACLGDRCSISFIIINLLPRYEQIEIELFNFAAVLLLVVLVLLNNYLSQEVFLMFYTIGEAMSHQPIIIV